jgi:hypothetical protein
LSPGCLFNLVHFSKLWISSGQCFTPVDRLKRNVAAIFDCTLKTNLFVQDDTEEGIVHLNLAVVLDEAQFPEFVHEEIDSGPRCANHLRQHLL